MLPRLRVHTWTRVVRGPFCVFLTRGFRMKTSPRVVFEKMRVDGGKQDQGS